MKFINFRARCLSRLATTAAHHSYPTTPAYDIAGRARDVCHRRVNNERSIVNFIKQLDVPDELKKRAIANNYEGETGDLPVSPFAADWYGIRGDGELFVSMPVSSVADFVTSDAVFSAAPCARTAAGTAIYGVSRPYGFTTARLWPYYEKEWLYHWGGHGWTKYFNNEECLAHCLVLHKGCVATEKLPVVETKHGVDLADEIHTVSYGGRDYCNDNYDSPSLHNHVRAADMVSFNNQHLGYIYKLLSVPYRGSRGM